jgi:hypothetical protein
MAIGICSRKRQSAWLSRRRRLQQLEIHFYGGNPRLSGRAKGPFKSGEFRGQGAGMNGDKTVGGMDDREFAMTGDIERSERPFPPGW